MTDQADMLVELRAIRALLEELVHRDTKPENVIAAAPPPKPAAKPSPAALDRARAKALRAIRSRSG